MSPDTRLSALGDPQEVQEKLGNVSHLYISGSLAEDILSGATVGDVISHLDASKLAFVIERLRKEERKVVLTQTSSELDSLKDIV